MRVSMFAQIPYRDLPADFEQHHISAVTTPYSITRPESVRTRSLTEETSRVFRARVVNPKWLEAITRHGYKGGLELAATVDYLFGYDATAKVVDDWMYEELARTYGARLVAAGGLRVRTTLDPGMQLEAEAADGCVGLYPAVRAMPVVAMQPVGQLGR